MRRHNLIYVLQCRRRAQRAIATAKRLGLQPKAVLPVDLFGQPADYDAIAAVAEHMFVIGDAAQSFGATYKGRPVGTLAAATATHPSIQAWQERLAQTAEEEARDRDLFDRELFYGLQSPERLNGLIGRYRRAFMVSR